MAVEQAWKDWRPTDEGQRTQRPQLRLAGAARHSIPCRRPGHHAAALLIRTIVIPAVGIEQPAARCARLTPGPATAGASLAARSPAHMACCLALQQRPRWAAPRASLPLAAAFAATARRQGRQAALHVCICCSGLLLTDVTAHLAPAPTALTLLACSLGIPSQIMS